MSLLLDIDPLTGAVETFSYERSTGASLITRTENVDALLAQNEASYNDPGQAWRGDDNDFWHVASVPLTLLQSWLDEYNASRSPDDKLYSFLAQDDGWERFMYAKVNSSDFRKLKTAPVNF